MVVSLKLGRKLTVISPHGFLLSFLARKIFLSFYVIYVIFNLFFHVMQCIEGVIFFLAYKLTETKNFLILFTLLIS